MRVGYVGYGGSGFFVGSGRGSQDLGFPIIIFVYQYQNQSKYLQTNERVDNVKLHLIPSKRSEMVCLQSQQTSWLRSTAQKEDDPFANNITLGRVSFIPLGG